jgi:hypothetical protein
MANNNSHPACSVGTRQKSECNHCLICGAEDIPEELLKPNDMEGYFTFKNKKECLWNEMSEYKKEEVNSS